MDCPKCGNENLLGDECLKCGILVSKYLEIQARKKTSAQANESNANNTSPESDKQPITLSATSIELLLSHLFFKYKKLIVASLICIFILFVIIEFTVFIKHTSNLVRLGIVIGTLLGIKLLAERWLFEKGRERRRTYYLGHYLKSDDWKRKRGLVLKRDEGRCVFCGAHATQVHHKRYAPQNIGREPIEWLASVCDACHKRQHDK